MIVFANWRRNPFTGEYYAKPITNESHTVEFWEEVNAYGIWLNEAPQLKETNPIAINEAATGGITFTEKPRTVAPNTSEFRVDYEAETFFGTGFIEFNPADDGTVVLVSYHGLGTILKKNYNLSQLTNVPNNLNVEGALTALGPASLPTLELTDAQPPNTLSGVGRVSFNDQRYFPNVGSGFIRDPFFKDPQYWLFDPSGPTTSEFTNAGVRLYRGLGTVHRVRLDHPKKYKCREGDVFEFAFLGIKSSSYDGNFRVVVDWYDETETLLSSSSQVFSSLSSSWVWYFGSTKAAPAGVDHFEVRLQINSGSTSGYFELTYFQFAIQIALNSKMILDAFKDVGIEYSETGGAYRRVRLTVEEHVTFSGPNPNTTYYSTVPNTSFVPNSVKAVWGVPLNQFDKWLLNTNLSNHHSNFNQAGGWRGGDFMHVSQYATNGSARIAVQTDANPLTFQYKFRDLIF